jgi:hypothetical protein
MKAMPVWRWITANDRIFRKEDRHIQRWTVRRLSGNPAHHGDNHAEPGGSFMRLEEGKDLPDERGLQAMSLRALKRHAILRRFTRENPF